jgi:hypothetical protein
MWGYLMCNNEKVTVFLNDNEIVVFAGLKVRDILSLPQVCSVMKWEMEVRDSYGHIVGLDGALMPFERYSIIVLKKNNTNQ